MYRHLRHFTALGDSHHHAALWSDDDVHGDFHDLGSAPPERHDLSFRDKLRALFSSNNFQVFVVCLVILDAICVLCELLLDLSIIESDHHEIAPKVFHYLSLALLTFFVIELIAKIFVFRLEFFKHKFEVFDAVIVVTSFVLDIVYIYHEDAFTGMGLLILLRLWRVARIINGIMVSVKNRAEHKVEKLMETNERLVHQVNDLQECHTQTEQENARLRSLLLANNIKF